MPANEANPIHLSERERRDLEPLVRQQTCAQRVALRARIVLLASDGVGIQPSVARLGIARTTVRNWGGALAGEQRQGCRRTPSRCSAPRCAGHVQRRGCLRHHRLGVRGARRERAGNTHWTQGEMADEAMKRGIVPYISQRSVGCILNRCRPQAPSRTRLAQRQARSAFRREVP